MACFNNSSLPSSNSCLYLKCTSMFRNTSNISIPQRKQPDDLMTYSGRPSTGPGPRPICRALHTDRDQDHMSIYTMQLVSSSDKGQNALASYSSSSQSQCSLSCSVKVQHNFYQAIIHGPSPVEGLSE